MSHQNAIHNNFAAGAHVLRNKFMFGRHIGQQNVVAPQIAHALALPQIGQRHQHVVLCIEPENPCLPCSVHCHLHSAFNCCSAPHSIRVVVTHASAAFRKLSSFIASHPP